MCSFPQGGWEIVFIDIGIVKNTLKKGIKVNISQLTDFLKFMLIFSPWFSDRGPLDAETLDTAGTDIKNWYTETVDFNTDYKQY